MWAELGLPTRLLQQSMTSLSGGEAARVSLAALMGSVMAPPASAQVPEDIYQGLLKIGQIVDPACTAKLYRPLMPTHDFNTYWPPDAAAPAAEA